MQADSLLAQGRLSEAMAAYRSVVASDPADAEAWYNLGYLLRCDRQFRAALDAYDRSIAAGVDRPEEVHLNRAAILSEFLDADEEAEAELRRALAAAPDFVLAWLNLGNLYEDRGDAIAARAAYDAALAIDPRCGRALARLAVIDVVEGEADVAIGRLTEALADPALPRPDAAESRFALGQSYDARGRYDEAFAAYAEANRLAATLADPRLRYDRAAHHRLIDRLIALPPAPRAQNGPHDPATVFICGMFRSGSTLVEQLFSRHSRVTAGGELDLLPAMAATRLLPYPEALVSASDDTLAALRDDYRSHVRALYPDADIVTDKRPDNFLHIGLAKYLFPDARIVHTTRNPIDNILSIYFLYFDDSVAYGHRLDDIVDWYRHYRRLMRHWKTVYGDDIHDIEYDALVTDPRAAMTSLTAFCGLAWEDGVIDPGQRTDALVRTASSWQVRQPIHRRSSQRWRHYAEHLAPILAAVDAIDD